MSVKQIKQRLDMILEFMQPHWEFVNCHMVNFLTDQHWERFIPSELRNEVKNSEQARLCIENAFWRKSSKSVENIKEIFPNINGFIKICKQHCLEDFNDILKTTTELKNEIKLRQSEKNSISVKEFLTDKKRHEVEIMATLVDDLINSQFSINDVAENVFIVDAGDGKGYLSSRLALEHGYKVLGIDANELNTENALERSRKLQRAWNGLVQRADLIQSGITPPRRGKKPANLNTETIIKKENTNYCTTAMFINTNLNLTDLLAQHFNVDNKKSTPQICLTGLHTCGNLAPTCLHVFHAEPNCRIICNIGCCYHFLKEIYTSSKWEHTTPFTNEPNEFGFPMSNYLRNKKIKLGRNARMLAAQCVERTLAACELPNISLFYRALLEVIICEKYAETYNISESIQVGRIRKFKDFKEYLTQCAKKTQLSVLLQLEAEYIDSIETRYSAQKNYLELFYLVRMLFAPILESLILLDRLLYLKELGHEKSYLVTAFDAIISPRHYAIIAIKN